MEIELVQKQFLKVHNATPRLEKIKKSLWNRFSERKFSLHSAFAGHPYKKHNCMEDPK
jgi:hypothetical protein